MNRIAAITRSIKASGPLRKALLGAGALGLALISGCTNLDFGPQFPAPTTTAPQQTVEPGAPLPTAAGETIGNGPVRVALLLPLTGDVATVGTSMANGARLAMRFIEQTPSVGENITLVLKDTAGDSGTASAKAAEAVREGASLVLGPLRADAVRSAGSVARSAGIPLIGFSNTTSAASPGVYLLNVLPETEVRRSLGYVQSQGRRNIAAIVPATEFGRIQQEAFRRAAADLGLSASAVYTFSNETEARQAIEQLTPALQSGQVDALFLPDRATAPSFGVLLETAQIDRSRVTLIGSADWDGDSAIQQTPGLVGAVYPAVDPAGQNALLPEYQSAFGGTPHPFASIAYTAVLLANSSTLSQTSPRYERGALTRASGFNGRDGLFRFLSDGRSEYALIMKQVALGTSQRVDGPRLP